MADVEPASAATTQPTRTYLLGAGASVEAGVPAAAEMVQRMHTSVSTPSTRRALEVAIAGLQAHNSIHRGSPYAPIDVEELYSTLLELAGRHTHRLSPFVGSWGHHVSAAEETEAHVSARDAAREIGYLLQGRNRSGSDTPNTSVFQSALEAMVKDAIRGDAQPFKAAARHVMELLITLSTIDDLGDVDYLSPFVATATRRPLWIASLNYDLGIELSAQQLGIDVEIGVTRGSVDFPAAPITLAKLHGSIDWRTGDDGTISRAEGRLFHPTLIFGSGNKLRVDGPFLDLLFAFRSRLDHTDELHVCGYSFRDDHVNHLIDNWLRRSSRRQLMVFDPALDERTIDRGLGEDRLSFAGRKARQSQITVRSVTASKWVEEACGAVYAPGV